MMMGRQIIRIFGIAFLAKLIFSYLDPGSGSILIQILIASLLSLTFFFGMFWRKIKSILGFSNKATDDELIEDEE